jgi:hypothetical protein
MELNTGAARDSVEGGLNRNATDEWPVTKFGVPHYESCKKKSHCSENIRSRTWENNSDYEHLARR